MLSYIDALHAILQTVQPLAPAEVNTAVADGLVLAEDVRACWDMPRCDNSAMDGYAVAGITKREGCPLELIGASYAGNPFTGRIAAGQAIRIMTGAAVPEGADTVIPNEDAIEVAGKLSTEKSFTTGQHIRRQGNDFKAGELLLNKGTLLKAGEISLLASAGVAKVMAYPRPKVAIIATGDELVELGETLGPGQIVNSNLYYLAGRLREYGCEPIVTDIGKDNQESLGRCLQTAMDADLILSTGGVSVGEKDQVQKALSKHNFQKCFWKVAIKPGKPLLFGMLQNKPFLGLPGNPAATAATFELFVIAALRMLAGDTAYHPQKRCGILTNDVEGGGNRQLFLWCRLQWHKDRYLVTVQTHQGSGQHRSIQGANALLPIPTGSKKILSGETVEVILLDN